MRDIGQGRDAVTSVDMRARAAGALLGLATGDALGLPVDFGSRAERGVDPVTGFREAVDWGGGRGIWSDETSLALCLADSIIESGFDPQDFGGKALRWLDEGRRSPGGRAFGHGGAVQRSLVRIRGGMPAVMAGGRGENDNGSASLARILPASIWLARSPEPLRLRGLSAYSAPTHGHPRCFLAVWLHCLVAGSLMDGLLPLEAYSQAMEAARAGLALAPPPLRAEAGHFGRVLDGRLAAAAFSSIRGSGYVVHCLEAALWCLLTTGDFRDCVLAAVNLGENANATAATAGGLAGLAYGRGGIPAEWLGGLALADEIESSAIALAELSDARTAMRESYWVLPGKLLAGPYPALGGADESRTRLSSLLDAGIDAVIDLTEDGESLGGRVLEPYWTELETLAAARGLLIERQRVPIRDMSAGGVELQRKALGEIDSMLGKGRRVYLHCLGGIGRTGMVVGLWLVEHGLAAPAEALGLIAELRSSADADAPASPETEEQRRVVSGWRPGAAALL